MKTTTDITGRGARRRTRRLVALVTALAGLVTAGSLTLELAGAPASRPGADDISTFGDWMTEVEFAGRVVVHQRQRPNTVEAAFARESYRPGATARLVVWTRARNLRLQILRVGDEHTDRSRSDTMDGVPVTTLRALGGGPAHRSVRVPIGNWRSGLYAARLTAAGGKTGFAPFVVRPRRLGTHPVAIVMPTYSWQAYNLRDDDGDGRGDSWYATWRTNQARLNRPYLDRGVPPRFRYYDLPFLRWLHRTGRQVDVLADADLNALRGGRRLASAYELIVFPGHHEYVTRREYDAITDYRNRGGNLAFLSANNFFWRVDLRGSVMTRVKLWRDLGRPEAGLIGTQYRANDRGEHRGAWILRRPAARLPWLFAGTGARVGGRFSNGGIEIDSTSPASPKGTKVIAEIPRLFGPGFTGQMTYYETRRGAKVFAAGAFTLAGSVRQEPVKCLLSNLIDRLANDSDAAGPR